MTSFTRGHENLVLVLVVFGNFEYWGHKTVVSDNGNAGLIVVKRYFFALFPAEFCNDEEQDFMMKRSSCTLNVFLQGLNIDFQACKKNQSCLGRYVVF